MPSHVLSESEYTAVKERVLSSAPAGMSEQQYQRWIGPAMAQALGEAENLPPDSRPPGGGPLGAFAAPSMENVGRAVEGAWKNLNPVTAITGLATAVRHPIDTVANIGRAQWSEAQKAIADLHAGRYSEMVGHGGAAIIPILGPVAAGAGERIATGDVAGGLGESAGLLTPFAAGPVYRGGKVLAGKAVTAVRSTEAGTSALDAVAAAADRASTNRIVDVAAPKVGPNKVKLTNRLAEVAPKLARAEDLSALSREGLAAKVSAKLDDAAAALDDANDARLASQQVKTGPILQQLDTEIAKMTASPVTASRYEPEITAYHGTNRPVRQLDPALGGSRSGLVEDRGFAFLNTNPRAASGYAEGTGLTESTSRSPTGANVIKARVRPGNMLEIQWADAVEKLPMAERTPAGVDALLARLKLEAADSGRTLVVRGIRDSGLAIKGDLIGVRGADQVSSVFEKRQVESIGTPVEPAPYAAQFSTLKAIRDEVARLGPTAPYEAVRRIRQAWDQVAKVKFLPSTAEDALKSQGAATAAVKGTAAIREALSIADPTTAAANAEFSLYKTAHDVLQATIESERARPRVLRGVLGRAGGVVAGAEAGGAGGALVGALLGGVVERAVTLAPTMKIVMARKLAHVADLLRGGNPTAATNALRLIARGLPSKTQMVREVAAPLGNIVDFSTGLARAADNQEEPPAAIGQR